jgi:hypothetical protein
MPTEDLRGITPLSQFLDRVNSATHERFAAERAAVAHEGAFAEMKNHVLRHYEGVEAQHSFLDENGSIFDCIPVEQQPALRRSAARPATPADLPASQTQSSDATQRAPEGQPVAAQSALQRGDQQDQNGNRIFCPEGCIPMRRLTLENLTRFETLQQFFKKNPVGKGSVPPSTARPAVTATHRWAHAYQSVNNLGGHSYLNVWDPSVIGPNQIFSLSQHWYVGGSGSGLQTAECGWQVFPTFYGNSKPVFFIYWTADDYQSTGCYNLTCAAFVQTSSAVTIGGTLSPVSTSGGTQYEIQLAYYLYQGNWWLYWGGTSASNAIGYYPTSLYKGGAMASHASEIDYGGEVVGTTSWPPMGSGAFANAGWQKACYQRDIFYFPTSGGGANASLTGSQQWPQCYTVTVTMYDSPWNETIFFGGPGGTNC